MHLRSFVYIRFNRSFNLLSNKALILFAQPSVCKNRDITTTDWQIFAKFGTIMQNGSINRPDR